MDLKYLWRITLTPIANFENYLICLDGTVINSKKGNVLTHSLNENGYLYVSLWKNNRAITRTVHRLVAEAFIPNPENKPIVNHKDANRANPHVDNLEWVTQSENIQHAYTIGNMVQLRNLTDEALEAALVAFLGGETQTALAERHNIGLSRLTINLRNHAVKTSRIEQFAEELKRQKAGRNREANRGKQKPVVAMSTEGMVVSTYLSITDAAKQLGKRSSGPISNVLQGRQKTAYGFLWKYA